MPPRGGPEGAAADVESVAEDSTPNYTPDTPAPKKCYLYIPGDLPKEISAKLGELTPEVAKRVTGVRVGRCLRLLASKQTEQCVNEPVSEVTSKLDSDGTVFEMEYPDELYVIDGLAMFKADFDEKCQSFPDTNVSGRGACLVPQGNKNARVEVSANPDGTITVYVWEGEVKIFSPDKTSSYDFHKGVEAVLYVKDGHFDRRSIVEIERNPDKQDLEQPAQSTPTLEVPEDVLDQTTSTTVQTESSDCAASPHGAPALGIELAATIVLIGASVKRWLGNRA